LFVFRPPAAGATFFLFKNSKVFQGHRFANWCVSVQDLYENRNGKTAF
jgi:hypothetical protein